MPVSRCRPIIHGTFAGTRANRGDTGQFAYASQVLALALTDGRVFAVKEQIIEAEIAEDLRHARIGMPDVRSDDRFACSEFCLQLVGLHSAQLAAAGVSMDGSTGSM
jgi:hypothetical protein